MVHARETVKILVGNLLEVIAPWIAQDLDRGQNSGRFVRAKRWILYARTARARAHGDARALQKSLFQFWRTDAADAYYDQYLDRYKNWFLGPHHELVDQMIAILHEGRYQRLVEMGCGAGRVLEHCATVMPEVPMFIGVDINPSIITRNKVDFAQNAKLQFFAANASVWLEANAAPGTILLSYGGVMEYFSAQTLSAMFRTLAQHPAAAVVLVEPVDPDHDLVKDAASHVYGAESSFSHNHEKLLEAAGYRVAFCKTLRLGGVLWVMLLATVEPQDRPAPI